MSNMNNVTSATAVTLIANATSNNTKQQKHTNGNDRMNRRRVTPHPSYHSHHSSSLTPLTGHPPTLDISQTTTLHTIGRSQNPENQQKKAPFGRIS